MTSKAELERVLRAVPWTREPDPDCDQGCCIVRKVDYPALADAVWTLWEKETNTARREGVRETWEAAAILVKAKLEECAEERCHDMEKAHVEARKWRAENDMYGWNFHEGMASGMNWADIIYQRIGREAGSWREFER